MNKPNKVKNCTTHHHACECREWRFDQMKKALGKIQRLSLSIQMNQRSFPDDTILSVNTPYLLEICNEGLNS